METKLTVNIMFTVSILLHSPHNAKAKPGNVAVNVKVHTNGKKVIDVSHPKRPAGVMKECCQRKGVLDECLGFCETDVPTARSLQVLGRCNEWIATMTECGKGVMTMKECCQRKGISDECLGFCETDVPTARSGQVLGRCNEWTATITECGKDYNECSEKEYGAPCVYDAPDVMGLCDGMGQCIYD